MIYQLLRIKNQLFSNALLRIVRTSGHINGPQQGVCGMGAGINLWPSCTEQGYQVYIAYDGLFHLSQHGTKLAVYDTDEAFGFILKIFKNLHIYPKLFRKL